MLKYLGSALPWIIYQWVAYVKYVLKAYIKFVLYTNQLQACALRGGGDGSPGDLAYTDGCIIYMCIDFDPYSCCWVCRRRLIVPRIIAADKDEGGFCYARTFSSLIAEV